MPVKEEQGFFTKHSPDEQPPHASNILGEDKLFWKLVSVRGIMGRAFVIGTLPVGLGFTEVSARAYAQSRNEEGRGGGCVHR